MARSDLISNGISGYANSMEDGLEERGDTCRQQLGTHYMHAKLLQSCLILCNTLECSFLGFSVQGIHQEEVLGWAATPSSRESSQSRNRTYVLLCLLHWQVSSLSQGPPGKP